MAIKSFNPGASFLRALVPSERSYLKILVQNARGCAYKRLVEPCAGAFAMSHLAAETGWPRESIDASDIMPVESFVIWLESDFELMVVQFASLQQRQPVVLS